ncbi:MAG: hypothetical protein ACI89U_000406 [Gammaproteobacteria bacterium]|jgi:hypothetical protein
MEFKELTSGEVKEVSGGLDFETGGLALIGVGLSALSFPVVAAGIGVFSITVGVGVLVGAPAMEAYS